MQKDKPPSVLGEALLDAVIARRPPKAYRPKRPDQPANSFVNRSGEIASAGAAPQGVDKGVPLPSLHEVQLGGTPPPPGRKSKTNRGTSNG